MSADYLTVGEVSEYLKLPEETVYKYARTGRIPASKVGRYWRFERSRIDAWVASRSNQAEATTRVYVADDDAAVRNLFAEWLRSEGCEVGAFADGNELLSALGRRGCDLVLLDLLMPAPTGVETLRRIRDQHPDLEVVVVTAYFDSHLMDEALEYGPLSVLKKPVDRQALLSVVRRSAERRVGK